MRTITLTLLLLFSLQSFSSFAQTAEVVGCDKIVLTSQTFDKTLISMALINEEIGPCEKLVQIIEYAPAKFWLEKKNAAGIWTEIAGPIESRLPVPASEPLTRGKTQIAFSDGDAAHGTYRGRISVPVQYLKSCGPVVYHANGKRNVDFQAVDSRHFITNEVVIGKTVPSDNVFTFLDINQDNLQNGFDEGDIVSIDVSQSQNYSQYWVAIFEQGPNHNRYNSLGWTLGTTNEVNLTNLWKTGHSNWEFELNHQYEVQFVVENNDCINTNGWNVDHQVFFICPFGNGCREVAEDEEILMTPNPASDYVEFKNLYIDSNDEYHLIISDLSGKTIISNQITSNTVNTSELTPGMYLVNILLDGKQIFTSKLVVNKW